MESPSGRDAYGCIVLKLLLATEATTVLSDDNKLKGRQANTLKFYYESINYMPICVVF